MENTVKKLRSAGIAARKSLAPHERKEAEATICRLIEAHPLFQSACYVLSYLARGGEPSLAALAAVPGKKLCYPYCTDSTHMTALLPLDEAPWVRDACGLLAPDPAHSAALEPCQLDLVLCPCTAFASEGRRLGSGRGYYDRYLPGCTRAHVFSVAFSIQKQEEIAAAPWDFPTEGTVTEHGFQ